MDDDDVLSICAPDWEDEIQQDLEIQIEYQLVDEIGVSDSEQNIPIASASTGRRVVLVTEDQDSPSPERDCPDRRVVLVSGAHGSNPVSARANRICPVCNSSTRGRIRRHVLRDHLPWFWAGTTACWQCQVQETQASSLAVRHTEGHLMGSVFDETNMHLWCQLINGSLHLLARWFRCEGLEELLQYVIDMQLYYGVRGSFSQLEMQLLFFYTENYSPSSPAELSLDPPSHVVCVTHWQIVATLLRRLGPDYHQEFREHRQCLTFEGSQVTAPLQATHSTFLFVDSHFHLDLVLQRTRMDSFQQLESVVYPHSDPCFHFGVANYVFPTHWNRWRVQVGDTERLYVSFGIHPHVAACGISATQWSELRLLSLDPRCVALGETGFDFTTRCDCHPCSTPSQCRNRMIMNQEEVFLATLELARERRLPVILHCRDSGTGEAARRALSIIQEGFLDLRYHRHCFTGELAELQEWQAVPKIVFGITGAFMRKSPNAARIIPRIAAHQLVLESDAPFLSPFSCCPVNHSWNLWDVSQAISQIRNVPLSILMWIVNGNAMDFYGLPRTGDRSGLGP